MRWPRSWSVLRGDDVDMIFLGAVLALVLLGTIAVFGAGSFQPGVGTMHYYLLRHLQRLALGIVVATALAMVDHVRLRRAWLVYTVLAGSLVLMALPVIMRGVSIDRWIEIPGIGQFQPIEIAKLALVLTLAYRLSASHFDRPLAARNLLVTLAIGPVALMVLLVLQPNFGNVVVMALVTLLMLFLAGLAGRWVLATVPAGAATLAVGFHVVGKLNFRISQWWAGWRGIGPEGEPPFGYQVHQSLLGMGAGGWRGLGPGNSHNKFAFLPENHTDFAFSFIGEEMGLLGTLIVVAALVILLWRSMVIARRATTPFGRLLAAGLGGMLFIYGAANVAMVSAVIQIGRASCRERV
jgi:cell division protein FtsW